MPSVTPTATRARSCRRSSILGPIRAHHHRHHLPPRPDRQDLRPLPLGLVRSLLARPPRRSRHHHPHRVGLRPVLPVRRHQPATAAASAEASSPLLLVLGLTGLIISGIHARRPQQTLLRPQPQPGQLDEFWATSTRASRSSPRPLPAGLNPSRRQPPRRRLHLRHQRRQSDPHHRPQRGLHPLRLRSRQARPSTSARSINSERQHSSASASPPSTEPAPTSPSPSHLPPPPPSPPTAATSSHRHQGSGQRHRQPRRRYLTPSPATSPLTSTTAAPTFSAHSVTGHVSVEGHAHDLTFSDLDGPVSMRRRILR